MGDFNAKIGKEDYNRNVAGKETIHETTNDNGGEICNLAAATNTYIVSTGHKHKKENKITWMIPGRMDGNQINHTLISKKWTQIVQDVRSYRGANGGTDHILLIAKLKMKIIKANNHKEGKRRKWNIANLKTQETKQQYTEQLEQKLGQYEHIEIEGEWKNIKNSIIETAEQIIGFQKNKESKEWFDEECHQKSQLKHLARNKWLQSAEQEQLDQYRKEKQEALKLYRRKKNTWISEQMQELETNNKDNKKLFE